jgi:hypothetical protein
MTLRRNGKEHKKGALERNAEICSSSLLLVINNLLTLMETSESYVQVFFSCFISS